MNRASPRTLVFDDPDTLHEAAAERIAATLGAALGASERVRWVLTGGSTVEGVYHRLAEPPHRNRLAWDRIEVFFTDERCVPPDHPDSNYRMASRALLDRVPSPCAAIHRMRGEDPNPERAAIEYEHRIRSALALGRGERPRFDLVLLGLGADTHVASLFPGDPAVLVEDRLALAVEHDTGPPPRVNRITLTAPALNGGRETLFVVEGESKAGAVRHVLEGPSDPARCPGQRIDPPAAPAVWLLDRAAARELSR